MEFADPDKPWAADPSRSLSAACSAGSGRLHWLPKAGRDEMVVEPRKRLTLTGHDHCVARQRRQKDQSESCDQSLALGDEGPCWRGQQAGALVEGWLDGDQVAGPADR